MNDETILNVGEADAAATKVGGRSGRGGLVALGALLALASCGLSAYVAEPSHEFYVMNRGLVALGGGLAAGGMLGFLDVDLRLGGSQSLRGGGGFAVFLVLFLLNPPAEVAQRTAPPERRALIEQLVERSRSVRRDRALEPALAKLGYDDFEEFKVRASNEQLQTLLADLKQVARR